MGFENFHPWSDEENQALKKYIELGWDYATISRKVFHTFRSKDAVAHQAQRLHINPNPAPSRQKWTEQEVKYLERNHDHTTIANMAKHLKRTESSVSHKMHKLHFSTYHNEFYSLKELCAAFNCDPRVPLRWHNKLDMPLTYVQRGAIKYYNIDINKFWKWSKQHPELRWSQYQTGILLPEPDFVKDYVNISSASYSRRRYEPGERKQIQYERFYKDLSVEEIAKLHHRSIDAIKWVLREDIKWK